VPKRSQDGPQVSRPPDSASSPSRWRSGPVDRRQDRPPQLHRLRGLRPVAGGQVDSLDLAHGRELGDVRMPLRDPLPQQIARELARDDRGRHVVTPLVGEHLGSHATAAGWGTACARNASRSSSSRSRMSSSPNSDQSGSGISPSTTGSSSLIARPLPSGPASTYTTGAIRSGLASAATCAIASPPKCPTSTTGPSASSTAAATASTWSRSRMPPPSASADSRPGSVSARTGSPLVRARARPRPTTSRRARSRGSG